MPGNGSTADKKRTDHEHLEHIQETIARIQDLTKARSNAYLFGPSYYVSEKWVTLDLPPDAQSEIEKVVRAKIDEELERLEKKLEDAGISVKI